MTNKRYIVIDNAGDVFTDNEIDIYNDIAIKDYFFTGYDNVHRMNFGDFLVNIILRFYEDDDSTGRTKAEFVHYISDNINKFNEYTIIYGDKSSYREWEYNSFLSMLVSISKLRISSPIVLVENNNIEDDDCTILMSSISDIFSCISEFFIMQNMQSDESKMSIVFNDGYSLDFDKSNIELYKNIFKTEMNPNGACPPYIDRLKCKTDDGQPAFLSHRSGIDLIQFSNSTLFLFFTQRFYDQINNVPPKKEIVS